MNRAYFSFAALCLIALSGSVLGNPVEVKEGIDTLNEALNLYNKVLDKVLPWSELNETISKLDKYRSDDYSEEAAALIREIKTNVLNGMDAYFRATQNVYELCTLTIGSLDTYKNLLTGKMDQDKFVVTRSSSLKELDDGITKMRDAQRALGDSAASSNVAIGKLISLNNRLAVDFSPNSDYYKSQIARIRAVAYGAAAPFMIFGLAVAAGITEGKLIPEFKEKMASIQKYYNEVTAETLNTLDATKAKLVDEIKRISGLKVGFETTQTYVHVDANAEVKESIVESVTNLITKCKEYQASHMNTN